MVRAAFAWNLAVEVALLGGSSTLLAPQGDGSAPLWPEPGPGPVGAELTLAAVENLSELHCAALDVAVSRAADAVEGGVVLVRVPPRWLDRSHEGRGLLRWVLLFASPEQQDLVEAYGLAKRAVGLCSETRVGLTVHGVRRVGEAERAYRHVSSVSSRHLGRPLFSYGLLVDDLHVYRAIVSRRPIGIEHPQSRAARAMRDVARLVLDDARKLAIA